MDVLLCLQARLEARSAKRRRQVDQLYELWDVNASGYLELEEIQVVLNKWRSDGIDNFKEGMGCPQFYVVFFHFLKLQNFPLKDAMSRYFTSVFLMCKSSFKLKET